MALNFSCEIISEKIIFPYMCLVCPCHFFTYIQYLKIYFSLYNLLYNCGRQNSTVLLKISRTSSPSIHAPSNPWEYRFNRFYSHDQVMVNGTIDFKIFFYCSSTVVSIFIPPCLPCPTHPHLPPLNLPLLVLSICPLYMFLDGPPPIIPLLPPLWLL